MYLLYANFGGDWGVYASFQERTGEYAAQVEKAAKMKKTDGKTESVKNAAVVMEGFVLGKNYYGRKYGKLVMRALRHFDEVGLSNDICASLEELLDEDADAFALLKEGEDINARTEGSFLVTV